MVDEGKEKLLSIVLPNPLKLRRIVRHNPLKVVRCQRPASVPPQLRHKVPKRLGNRTLGPKWVAGPHGIKDIRAEHQPDEHRRVRKTLQRTVHITRVAKVPKPDQAWRLLHPKPQIMAKRQGRRKLRNRNIGSRRRREQRSNPP